MKDVADDYEAAAEWCANRGITGEPGSPLPSLMSAEVVELIDSDPDAFKARIRDYAYALAMERIHMEAEE